MKSFIILGIGIIIFALAIIGLITLFKKKEGSIKKALIEIGIVICLCILEICLQRGADSFFAGLPVVLNYILPSKSTSKDISKPDNNKSNEKKKEDITDSEGIFTNSNHIHRVSNKVKEVMKDATCTAKGKYKIIEYCECGEEMDRTTYTVKKLGHKYSSTFSKNPTCEEQGSTTFTCDRCNQSFVEYEDSLGHYYEQGICTRCKRPEPN